MRKTLLATLAVASAGLFSASAFAGHSRGGCGDGYYRYDARPRVVYPAPRPQPAVVIVTPSYGHHGHHGYRGGHHWAPRHHGYSGHGRPRGGHHGHH